MREAAISMAILATQAAKTTTRKHHEKRLSTLIPDNLRFKQSINGGSRLEHDECPWICNTVNSAIRFIRTMPRTSITFTSIGLLP